LITAGSVLLSLEAVALFTALVAAVLTTRNT
jgi:hypothetical protein